MNRINDLDRALASYLEGAAAAPAPAGLLEASLARTATRRPRPAWLARVRGRRMPVPPSQTQRTLLIALGLLTLLATIYAIALFGGPRRPPVVIATASPALGPSASVSAEHSPVDAALRATWLAEIGPLTSLSTGAGPVSLTIASGGESLLATNFAPGAGFGSSISIVAPDQVQLVLDHPSGGCPAGAIGTYHWSLSNDGALLHLAAVTDECPTRSETLSRTWGRSLGAETQRGAGFVTTMQPTFSITLPDDTLSSRSLTDFIEIGGSNGFSLMAFKNPQGFASACSQDVRFPYTAGADAFVAYFRQNGAFTVLSASPLTVAGHHAVHLVTVAKTDYKPCPDPPDGFMEWTPKACDCHFINGPGGFDSLYVVDVGRDTFLFEVSPVEPNSAIERRIIESLQIPASVPSG